MPLDDLSGLRMDRPVVARRILVSGYVQGVGFRRFVQMQATGMGLRGFVRNVGLSSVEAVAIGEPSLVDGLCGLMGQGPPWARVDRLECHDLPVEALEPMEGFRVLPDVEEE